MSTRAIVVGVGNILRGDDGFGVAVIKRLQAIPDVMARAKVIEVGIGGVHLVQELMDGYDFLVIVDAVDRGGDPGRVYVLDLDVPALPTSAYEAWKVDLTDMHEAVPEKALALAQALGVLPKRVLMVGCQPARTDEAHIGLTPVVEAAVGQAADRIAALLDPVEDLKRRDEILQVMFWLAAEGLGPDVAVEDVLRFLDDPTVVEHALAHLVEAQYVERRGDTRESRRYRLTALGEREGRRCFLDEFEPYLARHAHGECGAANCDCHSGGAACREAGDPVDSNPKA
jgi:hydrogenase maturation protease